MRIYFDMDGTIANLYNVRDWLDKIIDEDSSPYAEAVPLGDLSKIADICKELQANGIKIGIISWLAKGSSREYNSKVRKAKRAWLEKNFPVNLDEIHIVKHGYPKRKVAGKNGDILFDDEIGNIENWIGRKRDRKGINCNNNFEIILNELKKLLDN
jgi:hypothetical protein